RRRAGIRSASHQPHQPVSGLKPLTKPLSTMGSQREPIDGLRGRRSGRRPSEPDPGNAGAGMVARTALQAGERCGKASVRQETTGASGNDGDVVVPLRRLRSSDGGQDHLDAVIVGGGTIGLACAWKAARRGLRVRVVERDEPGAGATHVAAGMLAPVGEANWGEEAMVQMSTASARAWPDFAAELERETGLESGYETRGALHVALDRDEAEELRRRFELMSSLDLGA